MDDVIDYESLFSNMRKENERLRMQIVGLKQNGYTLKHRAQDILSFIVSSPFAILYIFLTLSLLLQVAIPLIKYVMEERKREE